MMRSRQHEAEQVTQAGSAADPAADGQVIAAQVPTVGTASAEAARSEAWQILWQRRSLVVWALIGHIIAAACTATAPFFIGRLIGEAVDGSSRTTLITWGVIGLSVALFGSFMTLIAQWVTVRAVERAVAQLRDRVVEAIVRLPLAVVEQTGTGALVSRTTRDIATLSRFSNSAMPMLITITGGLAATIVAVPLVGGLSSLAFVLVVPWIVVVYRNHLRRSRAAYVRAAKADASADAVLNETVDAAAVVDALGVGELRQRRYLDALRRMYVASRYIRRLRHIFFPTPTSAVYIGTMLCVLWGAWLFDRGLSSLAQVSAVVLYTVALAPMLTILGFLVDDAQLTEVSLARLVGVLQVPGHTTQSDHTPQGTTIDCRRVSFAYRSDAPVLEDISVTIPQGQRVVVVGASGSGKSTLARLIAGVSAPVQGSVTLGGVPVVEMSHDEVFNHIMLLTQEYHVFAGSLRRNLQLAKESATDEEMLAALASVGASRWVDPLPDGLATHVSGGDHRLTPGQAQEVALARVVLANPPVVILDEATSLLDGAAAEDVEQAIDQALAGRTVIAIAHRLSVAEHSDRVLVMAAGQIVEDGSHEELLAAGADYATLWRHWHAGRDGTDTPAAVDVRRGVVVDGCQHP